jgi:hypothetical protein
VIRPSIARANFVEPGMQNDFVAVCDGDVLKMR